MKINVLLTEIEKVMNDYQNELKKLKENFEKKNIEIKKTIDSIDKKGIDNEISEDYFKLAELFSNIMNELIKVQNELNNDYFNTDTKKIIAKLKPRTSLNLKKNTEDWAQKIQDETLKAMGEIENCSNLEQLNKQLNIFAQAYVDAMYIKNNVISLLHASGVYERELNAVKQVYFTKIEEEKEKYEHDSQYENLTTYSRIQNLKDELNNIRSHEKELRLHNGSIEFGNGYNVEFLMGVHQAAPIKKDVIDFSKKHLKDDLHGFNEERLYWEPSKGALIVDLPPIIMSDRNSSKFFEYFEQILFTLFSEIPVRKLQIASIDCPAPNNQSLASPFVPILQRAEKKLGSSILYAPTVRDKSKVSQVIDALFNEGQNRSDTYFSENYENIYNYNKTILDNQHDFKFLIINNYPYGFNDSDLVAKLQSLIKNKDTGIIPIIFQSNDKMTYEKSKNAYSNEPEYVYLDPIELGAVHFTDLDFVNKTFNYNKVKASFDLIVPGFNNLQYWDDINTGYQSANILYLDKFLSQAEQINKGKYSIYDHKLRIPLGKVDGDIFDFVINVKDDSSAIILGTTGSGKSALMHTLILAAARTYSPRELNICLVDFKGVDASTEFSLYRKGEDLYLPHVNYLSLKSTTENALDMLDMLENLQNDRMKLIAKNKVANIVEYNNLPNIKNTNKILPRVLFIIDEFNTMLAGGASAGDDSSINDVIETRIFSLLTRVRSSGITIIFSGHSTAGLNERHMSQIKIRVGLNGFVGRLFEERFDEPQIDMGRILSEKGKSFVSNDLGKTKKVVSLSFSGETGSKRQISIAESIREKYASLGKDFEQVVAGSTDIMPISEMKKLKDVIFEEASIDEDSYSSYIGVTSTSSLPVSLRFSSEQSAFNYIMVAESNRLAIYERNVILGFIYMLIVRGLMNKQASQYASYIRIGSGIKDKYNKMTEYMSLNRVNSCLNIIENEKDACKEILKVYDIYQNRLKKSSSDISPYLLVLHNVSWLKDTTWLDETPAFEEMKDDDSLLDLENMDSDNLLDSLLASHEQNESNDFEEVKEQNEPIDIYKVTQALTTLFTKGYRQNVFVVLASPIYNDLDEFITASGRENIANQFSVIDGFSLKNSTKKYPVSCCHVNSSRLVTDEFTNTVGTKFVSSKTRLFEYSLENDKEFLKIFK